ncbi:MAG: IS4 family transposase [Nitrospiraceae bacterium]|nr:IS4 family transposase [Nitrospiraceae bacterium]
MVAIVRALKRVSREYRERLAPNAILQICRNIGHTFRRRVLGPVETIHLFLQQVALGNTACTHLRLLTTSGFTAAAYCQARARLGVAIFRELLFQTIDARRRATDDFGRWRGHRVFHVDGSSFSMPDTPELRARFGQHSGQRLGCGFPTAHLLALFDAATGLIVDVLAGPLFTHDLSRVVDLHPHLRAGDVLVGDRAFGTFAHLALLWQRQVHGVLRIQQFVITNFRLGRPHNDPRHGKPVKGRPRSRWVARLGRLDQIVEWLKPRRPATWMSAEQHAALPEAIRVRELRYRITRPGFRVREVQLVTTLLDPQAYPADALAELYQDRWQVETNLGHLKTTLAMDVLHCKTVDGVLKELYMFALLYNLVRGVMLESAHLQGVAPDRISFIDALRWLSAGGDLPLDKLNTVPLRPDRSEPRVVKRRPKSHKLMTKPRNVLRNALERQQVRA